jgi:hypothetical protein
VPDYEIFDLTVNQERAGREGVRVAELMVNTRTKSEAAYTLIAREIKARYSGYDAVMVEFTDLSVEIIPYNGGALIFNTPCGALSLGYVYGPPNTNGYVVAALRPPPLYPFQDATDATNAKTRDKESGGGPDDNPAIESTNFMEVDLRSNPESVEFAC